MPRPLEPSPLADVRARSDGEQWTLVFVRQLRHPRDKVWRALTDPAQLRAWAPYDADRDLGRVGPAVLAMTPADGGERMPIEVRRADAPSLLEHTWGDDLLRWELEDAAGGTRLTLRHSMKDRAMLPKVTAGWHLCVDVLDRALGDDPVGRIAGSEAMAHGWQALHDQYAKLLGG